jgi:hypothetical protein
MQWEKARAFPIPETCGLGGRVSPQPGWQKTPAIVIDFWGFLLVLESTATTSITWLTGSPQHNE